MIMAYYDPADERNRSMPPMLRTKALPIRFIHAKTAAKIAQQIARNRRRSERRETTQAVKACLRDELIKVANLIRTAYLTEHWQIEYEPPQNMKGAAATRLLSIIEQRLKKNEYEVATDFHFHKLTISWG
jgi:hypothetical protein